MNASRRDWRLVAAGVVAVLLGLVVVGALLHLAITVLDVLHQTS